MPYKTVSVTYNTWCHLDKQNSMTLFVGYTGVSFFPIAILTDHPKFGG